MNGISIWNSLRDKQEPENHKYNVQQLLAQKLVIDILVRISNFYKMSKFGVVPHTRKVIFEIHDIRSIFQISIVVGPHLIQSKQCALMFTYVCFSQQYSLSPMRSNFSLKIDQFLSQKGCIVIKTSPLPIWRILGAYDF